MTTLERSKMIVNELTSIENLYDIYGNNLIESKEFIERYNIAKNSNDTSLLIALSYEVKDFGDSIERNLLVDKIFGFFDEFEDSSIVHFCKSILHKHYIYNNRIDYVEFFKKVSLSKSESEILDIFKFSFESLFGSIDEIMTALDLNDNKDHFYSIMLHNELKESFRIIQNIGIVNGNFDSAYVWLDVYRDKDFYKNSAYSFFQWCKKNV